MFSFCDIHGDIPLRGSLVLEFGLICVSIMACCCSDDHARATVQVYVMLHAKSGFAVWQGSKTHWGCGGGEPLGEAPGPWPAPLPTRMLPSLWALK